MLVCVVLTFIICVSASLVDADDTVNRDAWFDCNSTLGANGEYHAAKHMESVILPIMGSQTLSKVTYTCVDGTYSPTNCIDEDDEVTAIGEKFEFDGYWIRCEVRDNGMYHEPVFKVVGCDHNNQAVGAGSIMRTRQGETGYEHVCENSDEGGWSKSVQRCVYYGADENTGTAEGAFVDLGTTKEFEGGNVAITCTRDQFGRVAISVQKSN